MLPHDAIVVVADGRSATLFRNVSRYGLLLEPSESLDPADGSAAYFPEALASHLNALACQQRFDDIAIIADPDTLRTLRRHYHKELQFRLRKEVAQAIAPQPEAAASALH
ncbi:host attachment protein [Paracoccus zeaxanthinifaciens]|uniref:baeRF12 domain-containing protein n=1 Tax=Paracoccus zeaxanthinifaciens TaxID=187400 RepID=UPI0003B48A98|nr:host attachment protein [Paracoccus zeaxanthinifaciens]